MKTLKRIAICIFILCLIGITSAFSYYKAVTHNVTLQHDRLLTSEKNLSLYDRNKSLIPLQIATEKQSVSEREIPWHTKQAFIDVEDRRFYKHKGFDYKGFARAVVHNVRSRSLKEGASTISQQLIKNTHLSQEKTLKRKLQEWKLTRQLEKEYSKEEIITKYLNTIYFGHSCFGIESASEFYFNKRVQDLSIAESATLAGMIKSPNHYSPFRQPDNCKKRRSCVLKIMQDNGSITQAQRQEAENTPLPAHMPQTSQDKNYPSFVMDELTELAEKYNFRITGRIEIQTYMDKSLQDYIETLGKTHTESGKSFIVLGKDGGFKAALSSVGNAKRLPGSVIKPLLVYAPAVEENCLSPATQILDNPIEYSGYAPQNYDGKFHGYVSTRECIEKSLNVPAVKVLSSLGISKCVAYLEKMDLKVQEEDKTLALALGGMKHGFSLTDLLGGYSVFTNNGEKITCGFIETIKVNGAVVYKKPTSAHRVFSPESAYLLTDMLKTTAQRGTAKKLRDLPFDVAAKTGTVGTKNGNTDAYALSYTTQDCIGVWLGNADGSKIEYTGGGLPCNYLKEINEYIYAKNKNADNYPAPFSQPQSVVKVELDKPTYYDTHTILRADDNSPVEYRFSELFKKSAIPLNKSTSFTFPSIQSPTISRTKNGVQIQFNPHSPSYYTYRIERSDYASHTTVYEGKFIPIFTDDSVEKNKVYTYTVTPFYQEKIGKTITLPTISTNKADTHLIEDKKILETDWWNNN